MRYREMRGLYTPEKFISVGVGTSPFSKMKTPGMRCKAEDVWERDQTLHKYNHLMIVVEAHYTKDPIFGQQKLEHTRRLEALTPGWWMLCRDSTAADLKQAGRSGLNTPVETSPNTSATPYFLDTTDNEGETSMD